MNRPKSNPASSVHSNAAAAAVAKKASRSSDLTSRGIRETIESIVIAVILAFLFRAFEAEAFVIPTGSMAPTLQGRHIDQVCEQCGHRYRTGASSENRDARQVAFVTQTTCPICRFPTELRRSENPSYNPNTDGRTHLDHRSYMGDRILVSKFAYELGEPQRWDVIVFKFPSNAKQNYIKRLIGLPGETILIKQGDIFVKKGDEEFRIARKPAHKLKAMLQLVDDTDHIADKLRTVGWPSRWQEWSVNPEDSSWEISDEGRKQQFSAQGSNGAASWLRYRHLIPRWGSDELLHLDWTEYIDAGNLPPDIHQRRGQLITDFYAYNFRKVSNGHSKPFGSLEFAGSHWVGDLGMEANVEVKSESGELLLDLVEGGIHYTCQIDVSSGDVTLAIDDGNGLFLDEQTGETKSSLTGSSIVRGPGQYQLRFANVDDELALWVDNRVVKFPQMKNKRATYVAAKPGFPRHEAAVNSVPRYSASDPGDAEPLGIGSRGASLVVHRLRVLRDVYYVSMPESDRKPRFGSGDSIWPVFDDPTSWEGNKTMFDSGELEPQYPLEEDQFLPLGDNSPSSSDARFWRDPPDGGVPIPYVERRLLTGKALFIYWPHGFDRPVPFTPNVRRMRFIR